MQTIHTMKVQLLGADKVNDFVKAVTGCPFSVFLISGRYRINAKSLIGIFSLDLSKPLCLEANCSDEQAETLFSQLAPFAVPNSARTAKGDSKQENRPKQGGLFGGLFGGRK